MERKTPDLPQNKVSEKKIGDLKKIGIFI